MKELETIVKLLTDITEDRTVPRNIRNAIEEAKKNIQEENGRDMVVKLSSAVSILDDIINDPNMPSYTRTQIWNIVSMIEMIKSKL